MFLAGFAALISSVSLLLFVVMWWARSWPKIAVEAVDLSVREVTVNRRELWLVAVKYSYMYEGKEYLGKKFSLSAVVRSVQGRMRSGLKFLSRYMFVR